MVATKNGGPVDINRALNNGLLVDPHDQQAIADALLKLVSKKNLWHECRKNGWKNIHLFSWPEHCRTYLTRVAACRMRHPQWQTDTPEDELPPKESLNDSLRDVQDMSLRLSIDGEKASLNEAFDGASEVQDRVQRVLRKMKKQDSETGDGFGGSAVSKYPSLRRRRRLMVIALDCYESNGAPEKKVIQIIQDVMKAVRLEPQMARATGFAFSTALPLSEAVKFLESGNILATEFDALICGSGSEVYYPGAHNAEDGKLVPDPDYAAHIDYRWGYDGLGKTICKLLNATVGEESGSIAEDKESTNSHCLSYFIKDPREALKVDDLRQKLRMRGLRCHPIYCRSLTRLQIVPFLASRAQALRYLFVRWSLNVSNMYVILGEGGDTDYEELIAGTHKTIIIKGIVTQTSEELLRTAGSYKRDDIAPEESPMITYINSIASAGEMADAIKQVATSAASM